MIKNCLVKVSCNLKGNNKPLLFIFYLFFGNFSFIEDTQKDFHNQISSLICKSFSCDQLYVIHYPFLFKLWTHFVNLKLFLNEKDFIEHSILYLDLNEILKSNFTILKQIFILFLVAI